MSSKEPPERLSRWRRRLITELADEGVDLGLDPDDPLFGAVVDEIAHARRPPVHELRRGPYGALVSGGADQFPTGRRLDLWDADSSEHDITDIRRMCNGLTTFLVRSTHGPEFLLELNAQATEQGLAQLVSPTVRVVQRTPAGVVKVFTPSFVYVFEHDQWQRKVYSTDAARRLEQVLFPDGPASAVEVLGEMLSFCLHILSTRHIGATFVWFPMTPTPGDVEGTPPSAVLHVNHRSSTEPFATLLAAIDGACFIGLTGRVDHIEVKLAPSDRAKDLVTSEGGLRHTSAKRYSFDDPRCIVFVVSQDGPVTVYSDGMSVLQLRGGPGNASSIAGVARHDIVGSHRTKTCPRCGKELVIERIHTRHADNAMCIACPVCRHPDLELDNAVVMQAWPQKPWTTWGVGAW